jgi:hypothetical protein
MLSLCAAFWTLRLGGETLFSIKLPVVVRGLYPLIQPLINNSLTQTTGGHSSAPDKKVQQQSYLIFAAYLSRL